LQDKIIDLQELTNKLVLNTLDTGKN